MVERDIVEIARRELGESGGGKYLEKETWWWDQQVQEAVKAKKEAFKNWRATGSEVDKEIYKDHRKKAQIFVTKAKYLAYEDMYEKLNTKEGQTTNAHLQVGKYQEKASAGHSRHHLCE